MRRAVVKLPPREGRTRPPLAAAHGRHLAARLYNYGSFRMIHPFIHSFERSRWLVLLGSCLCLQTRQMKQIATIFTYHTF